MDDDPMYDRDPEDDELARRLEAYAEARLSPELSATTRMRARVMASAHRQAALARADADRAAAAVPASAAQADRTHRSIWRRPLTALLAAALTLGIGVGSVAAAQAGGPLYGARIWAETLTLPANANERAQAELRRLEDRLSEAAAASAAGDMIAANAALDAYAAIVNEATNDAGNDVSAAATLDAGLRSNVDVLTVLVDRVPTEQARDAIQRAIDRSNSAIDKVHGKPSDSPGVGPTTDPTRTPKPDKTDQPDKTANPNKPTAAAGDPTAKPRPTPKVDPTVGPQATAEPEHTPPAGPPSEPPGGGPPSAPPGGGPPSERPGGGPPSERPGGGPPEASQGS